MLVLWITVTVTEFIWANFVTLTRMSHYAALLKGMVFTNLEIQVILTAQRLSGFLFG